jgi:lipid-A-disaccharide synthase
MAKKIMLIAGEYSGDLLAEYFIQQWPSEHQAEFYGIAGDLAKLQGMNLLMSYHTLAVTGFIEVLQQFKSIAYALNLVKKTLVTQRPDLLVLIDYPGFNLKVAKFAKSLNIKILYLNPPQVWAWNAKRIEAIREYVDHTLLLLPFEQDFYQKHKVKATLIPHPLLNRCHPITNTKKKELKKIWDLNPEYPVVGLLPGSRRHEVQQLLPIQLRIARLTHKEHPNTQWVLPLANSLSYTEIEHYLLQFPELNIRCIQEDHLTAMHLCDLAIATSGTVTLEAALLEIPTIIMNRINWLSFLLAKSLVKIKYIGLCNIIANQGILPEYLQHQVIPEKISNQLNQWLTNPSETEALKKQLKIVRQTFKKANISPLTEYLTSILLQKKHSK